MYRISLFLLLVGTASCGLFDGYKRSTFSYHENGQDRSVKLLVPKGYRKMEKKTDSAGNEQQLYYYAEGSTLYFARLKDTATDFQFIDYAEHIPKELYQALFFKRIDSANRYWRESRKGNFRWGYGYVPWDRDGIFDSSLNHFSRHILSN